LVGKADLAFDVPVDQAAELRNSGRFESSLAPAAVAYSFVGFPSAAWPNVKALSDPRVRLAIAKAIDRQALIDVQYGELGRSIKPSDGLCSKEQLGCGFTKLKPDYDPAGAKKLLAEAGYADGFDVTISTHPTSVVPATAVSGMLRAVGIRASVRPHQIVQRVQLINQGKVEIGFYGWSGGALFEASGQIVRHVGSKEYDDPALANMANATMGMMDDAERRKAVAKVFDYIHDNAYAFPMVPLRSIYTHTKEVKLDVSDEIRESQLASVHEFSWK
jgi:peptide/nickel transport system substrate-binding protein